MNDPGFIIVAGFIAGCIFWFGYVIGSATGYKKGIENRHLHNQVEILFKNYLEKHIKAEENRNDNS